MFSFIVTALISTVSVFANSSWEKDLLRFERQPGFVPAELAVSVVCTVTNQRVIKTTHHFLSDLETVQEMKVSTTDFTRLEAMIDEADKGEVETAPGPVDAPSLRYEAFIQHSPSGPVKSVMLFEQDGGSGRFSRNTASVAKQLVQTLDTFCK